MDIKRILLGFILIFPIWVGASNAVYDEISSLGKDISNTIPKNTKIAVTEFVDLEGNVSSLGKFIAEELITELTILNGKEITVIERRLLMKVLDEQKLSISEFVDPDAIKNVGKLLGAGAIVTGTITELGDEVRVNARIVSTKTGEIESVARATIPVTGVVKKLMSMKSKSNFVYKPHSNISGIDKNDEMFFQHWKGIDLKVLGCSKNSSKIQCDILATSTGNDLVLNIHRATAIFDDIGNKKNVKNVQYGSQGGTDMGSHEAIYKELIQGVPVKTSITFDVTDKKASQVSALKLSLSKPKKAGQSNKRKDEVVTFRSIPL